jgi:hypothetical protein
MTATNIPILQLMDEIEMRHGINENRWGILRGILEAQKNHTMTQPVESTIPEIPKTDEEVIALFDKMFDGSIKSYMAGIYKCRRGRGEDVLLAYENALLIALGRPAVAKG